MKYEVIHDIVDDIVFHSDIVTGLNMNGSIEWLTNGRRFHIGFTHVSISLEAYCITIKAERLSNVENLHTKMRAIRMLE